jgi:hypothetical protein
VRAALQHRTCVDGPAHAIPQGGTCASTGASMQKHTIPHRIDRALPASRQHDACVPTGHPCTIATWRLSVDRPSPADPQHGNCALTGPIERPASRPLRVSRPPCSRPGWPGKRAQGGRPIAKATACLALARNQKRHLAEEGRRAPGHCGSGARRPTAAQLAGVGEGGDGWGAVVPATRRR